MKKPAYRHTRHLLAAGALGVTGQMVAITFMLQTNPYTTFAFMTFGSAMIVSGIAIFSVVMFWDIRARTESLKDRFFKSGDVVFRQGDAGDRVYIVKEGELEVIREDPDKGEMVIARLGKGEYFGEMALLSDAPRNASVRAVTNVTALAIERDDFHALFSSIPALEHSVRTVMEQRKRPLKTKD